MLKLPQVPFKVIGAGDDHPFVIEALRRRKPYEPCWCGSGRKFKKCHRFREQLKPFPLGQLLDEQARVFWRNRGCMHPHASPTLCRGKVVDAHSIQRKGPLEKITSSNNHVCRLEPSAEQGVVVKEIGWKKASTFPGYCAEHDSRIFGVLEQTPFTGTHEQCVLQAYRSVCNELYKKRALIESLQFQRDVIDRGCEVDEQINRQLSVATNIAGQTKSLQELEELWLKFEGAVTRGEYDRFSSRCYFLTGDLSVASSAALHAEFDFHGNVLVDMWDLEIDAEMLSHSIMATDKGGVVVFVWLAGEKSPELVVSSFDKVASDEKGDVFVQYCFLNSENTYFSREWWNGLDEVRQAQLRKYSEALFYEGGTFVPNQNRLVNWSFGD